MSKFVPESAPFVVPNLSEQRLIARPSWHEYFLAVAKIMSTRSTCSSRPVGCVIVKDNRILVSGYNGPPPGAPHCSDKNEHGRIFCMRRAENIPDSDKLDRCPSVHAEENAVALAESLGLGLQDTSVYITLAPCIRCLERLASAGVRHVYYELAYRSIDPERDRTWEESARQRFETYEQISLSQPSLRKLAGALIGVTSARLLPSE